MFVRQAQIEDFDAIASFDEWQSVSTGSIRSGHVFVAGTEDAVTAFGIFDRSFFKRQFVAILFVSPHCRRCGLGSALLSHFESIATDGTIWISTNVENIAMQTMLHKHGFTLSGVVHDLAKLPELVYSKSLAAGRAGSRDHG